MSMVDRYRYILECTNRVKTDATSISITDHRPPIIETLFDNTLATNGNILRQRLRMLMSLSALVDFGVWMLDCPEGIH